MKIRKDYRLSPRIVNLIEQLRERVLPRAVRKKASATAVIEEAIDILAIQKGVTGEVLRPKLR